jgi:hypothetical protein
MAAGSGSFCGGTRHDETPIGSLELANRSSRRSDSSTVSVAAESAPAFALPTAFGVCGMKRVVSINETVFQQGETSLGLSTFSPSTSCVGTGGMGNAPRSICCNRRRK